MRIGWWQQWCVGRLVLFAVLMVLFPPPDPRVEETLFPTYYVFGIGSLVCYLSFLFAPALRCLTFPSDQPEEVNTDQLQEVYEMEAVFNTVWSGVGVFLRPEPCSTYCLTFLHMSHLCLALCCVIWIVACSLCVRNRVRDGWCTVFQRSVPREIENVDDHRTAATDSGEDTPLLTSGNAV